MVLQQSTHKCLYRVYRQVSRHGGARLFSTLSNAERVPCIVLQNLRILAQYLLCSILPRLWGMLSVGGIALLVDRTRA